MPNWCSNTLTLTHSDPAMITRATTSFIEGHLLNEFIPRPQALVDTIAGSMGYGTPEQAALEAKEQQNLVNYGYKNWYDFSVAEWGTKWDIGGADSEVLDSSDNTLKVRFESAWGPPIGAYEKLQDLGFGVHALYNEFGMAFCGIWSHGVDNYYEYAGESPDDIRNIIPVALEDEYGIAETIERFAEENDNER